MCICKRAYMPMMTIVYTVTGWIENDSYSVYQGHVYHWPWLFFEPECIVQG